MKEKFPSNKSKTGIQTVVLIEKSEEVDSTLSTILEYLRPELQSKSSSSMGGKSPEKKYGLLKNEKGQNRIYEELVERLKVEKPGTATTAPSENLVDVEEQLSLFLTKRRSQDAEYQANAAKVACEYFADCSSFVFDCVGRATDTTHLAMTEKMIGIFDEKKEAYATQAGLDEGRVSNSFDPCVQSGGRFKLKPFFASSPEQASYDCLYFGLCVSFNDMGVSVGRTVFVDPQPEVEADYALLYAILTQTRRLQETRRPA